MNNLIETEEGILERNICIVDIIRNKNVEVDWLYKRITAALEAKKTLKQFGTLVEKGNNNMKSIEDAKIKLGEVEARKKRILDEETSCQKELAIAKDKFTKASQRNSIEKQRARRETHSY